jgi:hypothetical protein
MRKRRLLRPSVVAGHLPEAARKVLVMRALIFSGTPAGVGLAMKPPLYLKAGDVVELGIDSP